MLNLFQSNPRAPVLTGIAVIAVTLLVVLEKFLTPLISRWGDIYPAAALFLVIACKTIIPLTLLWYSARLGPDCLSWVQGGMFQALWKGVVLALFMMVVAGLYQNYSALVFHTPYVSTGLSTLQQTGTKAAIALLLSASLLNAFGEEIIFRGMLMPVLSMRRGMVLAVIVQSVIFTGYHFFPLQNSVLLFIMGILFALGYLWSGSLLTPVVAHLIENGTGVIVYLVKILAD